MWPGESHGKGAAFPIVAARVRAEAVARRFVFDRAVVLLGKRAARAFGIREPEYFRPVSRMEWRATVFVVPHPSGVNRWYNERRNVRRMRRFMTAIAKGDARWNKRRS